MNSNLNDILLNSAAVYPDQPAIIFQGESISYQQVNQTVNRMAAGLASLGIGKGDVVALLLDNSPHFVTAYFAILRTGAAVVPINPIFTAREISYILANCGAKAAIALPALEPLLSELTGQLPELKTLLYTGPVEKGLAIGALLETADDSFSAPPIDTHDLAVILYTSGTTGQPKGAMLSHGNMSSNASACLELFDLAASDRMVAVLPMFHVFCMTVCMNGPITAGATILIVPKFQPAEVVRVIREERATVFAGVPTMYNFLLQLPEASPESFRSVRLCISGGASMPVELLHRFEEKYKVIVLEGYGLSEAAPATTFNPLRGVRKAGSIGVDIPGVTNKVVDSAGREVPRGEIGELIVKGPNVMLGYLGMPEATAQTLKDGWLYTGDLARMDEDGYIYIVDRKKDMVLVGGYNVYPREVEEVLYQHPAIVEAAVVGVPDEQYGEAIHAFVVSKSAELSEAEVIRHCQERLAKYKVPRRVEFLAELPKNSTGKIMRRALRERYAVNER